MNINVSFAREELKNTLTNVVRFMRTGAATETGPLNDAWVSKVGKDHWEFHFGSFYWHGSADNAYDARSKGWTSWLRKQGAEGYKMEAV